MSLSVGIVGLPNAGKSTLFNVLRGIEEKMVETSPRPFTTIEPNIGVVPVSNSSFEKLVELVNPEKTVPATVTFIDIAGLIKGAHKGEGLGNQFLAKIREVDVIVHVVRSFENDNISHVHADHKPGSLKQILDDIEIINIELELGDIKDKPTIYVLNVSEKDVGKTIDLSVKEKIGDSSIISLCAKLEEELVVLNDNEKQEFLKELKIDVSGIERLIAECYSLLGLISFFTIKGGKETSAWSIKKGSSALEAAAVVHTDFANKFIKAEVINVHRLLKEGSWKGAKEKGLVRLEGKDYLVQDEDVIEFKVGS